MINELLPVHIFYHLPASVDEPLFAESAENGFLLDSDVLAGDGLHHPGCNLGQVLSVINSGPNPLPI